MSFKFKKNILLTGAGFTANFGGFLAKDIWNEIFNNMPHSSAIKQLLIDYKPNFERVYSEVLRKNPSEYDADEKTALKNAVKQVYRSLDKIICNYIIGGLRDYGISYHDVRKFLGSFAGSNSGERGAIFTLNQDLFLERLQGFKHPLYGKFSFSVQQNAHELQNNQFIWLPTAEELQKNIEDYKEHFFDTDGDLFYIKLHGSYGYLASNREDLMVLGEDKEDDITKEPLLAWYKKIFEEVLFRDDVKLLIIGYSFNDQHINKILHKAIETYGLKFCILSPSVDGQLEKIKLFKLEKGLYKIFQKNLAQIFPANQRGSEALNELIKIFPPRQ